MEVSGETRKAHPRERTIEVKIRFFTNGFDDRRGYIKPKHGWTRGTIEIQRNDSHGIIPKRGRVFNSLMEISQAVEKVLIDHGITLHCESKMAKYIKEE